MSTAAPDATLRRRWWGRAMLWAALNDLFEPFVQMRAAKTANAPKRPEDLGIAPGAPIARRIRVLPPDEDA